MRKSWRASFHEKKFPLFLDVVWLFLAWTRYHFFRCFLIFLHLTIIPVPFLHFILKIIFFPSKVEHLLNVYRGISSVAFVPFCASTLVSPNRHSQNVRWLFSNNILSWAMAFIFHCSVRVEGSTTLFIWSPKYLDIYFERRRFINNCHPFGSIENNLECS